MRLVRHVFFEMNEGKSKMDQHFATMNSQFARYHKKGMLRVLKAAEVVVSEKDITSIEDIGASLSGLQFTTIWRLDIDHSQQKASAKALMYITRWSDFEYIYQSDIWIGITIREQSRFGKGTFLSVEDLHKLWKDQEQFSTGML